MPASTLNWSIQIVDEKQDAFKVDFYGTVEQVKAKALSFVEKLQKRGLSSEVQLTLKDDEIVIYEHKKGRWSATLDGLVMGFSNSSFPQPFNEKAIL